jgi:hypothetical protein
MVTVGLFIRVEAKPDKVAAAHLDANGPASGSDQPCRCLGWDSPSHQ